MSAGIARLLLSVWVWVSGVTARLSPLQRRHMLPSGCSCKSYSPGSTRCCRARQLLKNMLRREEQKAPAFCQEDTRQVKYLFTCRLISQQKGRGRHIGTHLGPVKWSPGSCWRLCRCCASTGGTLSHSHTCLRRSFRSTCPACYSTLSWQGFPGRTAGRWKSCWRASVTSVALWTNYRNILPGIPLWRNCSHLAVRAGFQAEAEELLLWGDTN